jgi:signal transduction histidine kinase
MHAFLLKNRDELLARSEITVRQRVGRRRGVGGGEGLDRLLDRLTSTLDAAHSDEPIDITKAPSPASKAWVPLHGSQGDQQELDFALSDVVHSYSDVVQTVRDVALEKGVSLGLEEFRALDECLDSAITEAVTDFNALHDDTLHRQHREDTRERVGFLVHELRNAVGTASLAASALDTGAMTMNSPMGAVLKRSLASLNTLMHRAVEQVRCDTSPHTPAFSLAEFIADAQNSSQLDASAKGCHLAVPPVDSLLMIRANRELLQAALANLLQNAFKFTHPHSEVTLRAYALGNHIIIQVEDHCGGLAAGKAEKMFMPFHQRSDDKSGLGLGLSIARKSIEQDLGTLNVRDLPGTGCVFEIRLPRFWPQ